MTAADALPTWEECDAAIASGNATPLQLVIYHGDAIGEVGDEFRKAVCELIAAAERRGAEAMRERAAVMAELSVTALRTSCDMVNGVSCSNINNNRDCLCAVEEEAVERIAITIRALPLPGDEP